MSDQQAQEPGQPEPSKNAPLDDDACQDCGRPNPVWFAPNEVWNLVMGGPEATDDPGGYICPTCFLVRAEEAGVVPTGWLLAPEVLG